MDLTNSEAVVPFSDGGAVGGDGAEVLAVFAGALRQRERIELYYPKERPLLRIIENAEGREGLEGEEGPEG